MTATTRLDRLFPALTVEERLDALLAAFHEDQQPDWHVASSIPEHQAERWNFFVGLLNATHTHLGWYVHYVESLVTQVELRFGLLCGARLAGLYADEAHRALVLDTPEPITEMAYAERVAEQRALRLTIPELAEWLAEDEAGDSDLSDREFARRQAAAEKRLRLLVKDGVLDGAREDRELTVSNGSYHDWRGTEVAPIPEYGMRFAICPDSEQDTVVRQSADRSAQRERLLKRRAIAEEMVNRLEVIVAGGLAGRWQEVRLGEMAAEALKVDFAGRDPLHPEIMATLADCRERLLSVHESLKPNLELELTDPAARDLAELLLILQRAARQ